MNRLLSLFAGLLFAIAPLARCDDWPQWLGPQRDGVWRESGLAASFPKEGPKLRWRTPIGSGYAGPAVAGGRVYLTDRSLKPKANKPPNPFKRITQPGYERVVCLDEASGKQLWEHQYDCDYTMSYSAGPRATPTVDGDRVYTLGGEGDLLCLETATGKPVWHKHLSSEESPTPVWGFAGHPLVDGDRVICLTAGKDPASGMGVVTAFDKHTGAIIWTALPDKEPGYSAPIIVNAGGRRQLIVWHPASIDGLDPETGKVYWTQAFGPAKQGLTVGTPRFAHDERFGDLLFLSTQYEGSMVLKLDANEPGASVLWKRAGKIDKKTEALHSLMASPIVRGGNVYGIDSYGELRCLDLANGDRRWATAEATTYDAGPQKWSTAFLIPIGERGQRFLIPNEHGDLILADLDPQGYHEISRAHVLEPTNKDPQRPVVWCFPACADRSVFWRNDKEIIRVSLSASPE